VVRAECLHGYVTQRAPRATIFPIPLALGATFDAGLVLRLASMISDEARAYHNQAMATSGIPQYAPCPIA
jgi:beta-glucosidase